jgi:UDP-N-acetyl-D-glucosamine dehydrogenase
MTEQVPSHSAPISPQGSWLDTALQRIDTREITIAIIGMGYVGLPLAVEFARAGIHVTGVDVDLEKVNTLNAGKSYITDIEDADVAPLVSAGLLRATDDYSILREMDAAIICVPTPLSKSRDPDISYIVQSADQILRFAHAGMVVVLESTTYPGTTEELLLAPIEEAGYTVGEDIFLAFSPERIDPANPTYGVRNTPKVIGGMTPNCTRVTLSLYQCAVDQPVPVSSPRAAEMVKLLENTFRAVNIGLANEWAIICDKLDTDIWEVIDAATTKPYGFMPFYPGPGLGGHCLPIDPLYLSWRLRALHYSTRFIELADNINSNMPRHVVEKITDALNAHRKPVNGSRLLVLGVAYKPNVDDVRESPAFEIIEQLLEKGGQVSYHDPFVPHLQNDNFSMQSVDLTAEALRGADCIIVITNHEVFDWTSIAEQATLIVDTRNALGKAEAPKAEIVRL